MAMDIETLRAALARGEVPARVTLSSGPCWGVLTALRQVKGRGGARAVVRAAGVTVELGLDAVLELKTG